MAQIVEVKDALRDFYQSGPPSKADLNYRRAGFVHHIVREAGPFFFPNAVCKHGEHQARTHGSQRLDLNLDVGFSLSTTTSCIDREYEGHECKVSLGKVLLDRSSGALTNRTSGNRRKLEVMRAFMVACGATITCTVGYSSLSADPGFGQLLKKEGFTGIFVITRIRIIRALEGRLT